MTCIYILFIFKYLHIIYVEDDDDVAARYRVPRVNSSCKFRQHLWMLCPCTYDSTHQPPDLWYWQTQSCVVWESRLGLHKQMPARWYWPRKMTLIHWSSMSHQSFRWATFKTLKTFYCTDWFTGILTMAYYYPYSWESTANSQGFGHCSGGRMQLLLGSFWRRPGMDLGCLPSVFFLTLIYRSFGRRLTNTNTRRGENRACVLSVFEKNLVFATAKLLTFISKILEICRAKSSDFKIMPCKSQGFLRWKLARFFFPFQLHMRLSNMRPVFSKTFSLEFIQRHCQILMLRINLGLTSPPHPTQEVT